MLRDYCWVCLNENVETLSVGIKYGYPVCEKHMNEDFDPEAMEMFVINLFR